MLALEAAQSGSGSAVDAKLFSGLEAHDDVAAWINSLLAASAPDWDSSAELEDDPIAKAALDQARAGPSDLARLERQLQRLSTRVEIASQDTAARIDRTIDEVERTVPRLGYDLHFMRESALAVRESLSRVRAQADGQVPGEDVRSAETDVASVARDRTTEEGKKQPSDTNSAGKARAEDETTTALARLAELDLIKTRMEAARDVLREAESWSTLEVDISTYLSEGKYEDAAARLAEASSSLAVFARTPEYEARRALMLALGNALEAAASAPLVAAIAARDVAACARFRQIFGQVGRQSEFRNYYFGSRRSKIVAGWRSAALLEDGENSAASLENGALAQFSFADYLTRFYAELQSILNEERLYVPSIFPDPHPTLAAFVASTFDGLEPPFSNRLSQLVRHHGDRDALPQLIRAYRSTEEFALAVDHLMVKIGYGTSGTSPGGDSLTSPGIVKPESPSQRRMTRRMSRRMSAAPPTDMVGSSAPAAWEQAVFDTFLDWQIDYGTLEKRLLLAEWELEAAARAAASASVARSASEFDFTKGDAAARVLWQQALAAYGMAEEAMGRAQSFTHGFGAVGLLDAIDALWTTYLGDARRALEAFGASQAEAGRAAAVESEYAGEDWGTVQLGLKLLDAARGILERVASLETLLARRIVDVAAMVRGAASGEPFALMAPGTTRGALLLLHQSPLNSLRLREVIDSVDAVIASDPSHIAPTTVRMPPAGSKVLLPAARGTLQSYVRSAQRFVQDAILAPLLPNIESYAALPAWTATNAAGSQPTNEYALRMPTFSVSPTEAISRVGEGLLNLPRLFEVYAADDALAFSLETLPHLGDASRGSSSRMTQAAEEQPAQTPTSTRRMSFIPDGVPTSPALERKSHRHSASAALVGPPPTPTSGNGAAAHGASGSATKERVLSAEEVLSTWLRSLTLGLLSRLLDGALPSIPRLTSAGAAQLAADLDYLNNIVSALNVNEPIVAHWRDSAALSDEEGRDLAGRRTKASGLKADGTEEGLERSGAFEMVARMRGWIV